MLPPEIIGLLGLAQRAGKIVIGTTAVTHEIRRGREDLLLIFAKDFSPATKEKMLFPAAGRAPVVEIGTMQEWGKHFGRQQVGVIAVVDKNFAAGILQKLPA